LLTGLRQFLTHLRQGIFLDSFIPSPGEVSRAGMVYRVVTHFVASLGCLLPFLEATLYTARHQIEGSFYSVLIQQRGSYIYLTGSGVVKTQAYGYLLPFRPVYLGGTGLGS
jgi:hypothetical protein